MGWEKIFANHISDKRSITRIYKELLKLNSGKTAWLKKWAKNLNRHFTKQDIQMFNKHTKDAQHH